MKITKGDNVLVTAGKDKGKKGKVIRVLPVKGRVVVDGVNMRKKHMKPRRMGEHGQVVEIASPLDVSNIKLVCPKCSKATRIGYHVAEDRKYRVCKRCGSEISSVA